LAVAALKRFENELAVLLVEVEGGNVWHIDLVGRVQGSHPAGGVLRRAAALADGIHCEEAE
jgi:hypothetical protein